MSTENTNQQTPPNEESTLLKNILGMIEPETKDVRPPTEESPKVEEAKKEEPPKKEETPPPAPKKVAVRKKEPVVLPPPAEVPEAKIEEIVKRTVAAQKEEPKPAPAPEPELRPEQKDEYELAKFLEGKDPAKKGLSQKMLAYYEAEKKFLERRLSEEGEDYDPATDPEYRKFLAKNPPPLTAAERKNATTQRIAEEAETRAAERVKKELTPELEQTKRKLREFEERPKIQQRVNSYLHEVASGMPEEVYKYFQEVGGDTEKVKEAFPLEFDIIEKSVTGALHVAEEFLSIRAGLKDFDPQSNPQHKFVHEFVDERAKVFLQRGGEALTRGGKQFVHPYQWKPGMEATHWTFDDEDVLNMLKSRAQFEAKSRIAAENKRIESLLTARQKRTTAPKSAEAPPVENASPKIGTAPAPGVAKTEPVTGDPLLGNILGFAPKGA